MLNILVKLEDPGLPKPKNEREGDAGYDVFSTENVEIDAGAIAFVRTGLRISIPKGYFALLCLRSSMVLRNLTLANCVGIIDSGFRGEIKIAMRNLNDTKISIQKYERVAQLIMMQHYSANFIDVATLESSDRADGGFGSTGRFIEG
jgi:dUTP pyrophosphatase